MSARKNDRLVLVAFIVGCQLVGIISGFLFSGGDSPWFEALEKPPFQPPGSVFGPVWGVLYALMGIAAWRIWRLPNSPGRTRALRLFAAQLVLNALWTPIFFGAQRPSAALFVLGALWGVLVLTILAFRTLDKPAARLLLPYIAWSTFAVVLNASIVALN